MIFEIPNFLSEQECIELIGLGESNKFSPGKISSRKIENLQENSFNYKPPNHLLGIRKALIQWIDESDQLISRIKRQVSEITGLPESYQETFHLVKYQEGGEYKTHYDRGKNSPRVKTAMIYLNEGFEGGETHFSKINRTIIPETGKLVVWDNVLKDGSLDLDSQHAGLPVEFGTKYIGVIWISESNLH
jgi:hypothetical protein